MVSLNLNGINDLDKITRLNLINSIAGFKQPNLISTIGKDGVSNLAIFSSVVHLGSNPPLIGFITRPTMVPRHTYSNILETKYYTINLVNNLIIDKAHQTSAKYDKKVSEFDAVGLTETKTKFPIPYVKESLIKFGCELEEEIPIKSNGTILMVGKIKEVILPEDVIQNNGKLDLSSINTVASTGLGSYYETNLVKILPKAIP